MERIEMRISLPPKERVPQMASVMGKGIKTRITSDQPTRDQINRQRKAVHLDKERNNECGERPERAPVPAGPGPGEAECENNEDQRIDNHERPKAIGRLFRHFRSPGPRSPRLCP